MGVMDGVLLGFMVPIGNDLVQCSTLTNQAMGYYHGILAPTVVAGAVVAGALFEKLGNYDVAFYLGGGTCLLCALLLIVFILVPELYEVRQRRIKIHKANEDEKGDNF
jgi:hypothetical protein